MNKVYIFGAGASEPAGAPLLKEFIGKGFSRFGSYPSNKNDNDPAGDNISNYLNFLGFLKDKYSFDFLHGDSYKSDPYMLESITNIEKIISEIDEEIRKGNKKSVKAREEAIRFVFTTLNYCILLGGGKKDCYPNFIDKKIDVKNINQTIITFNYETLFEHALFRKPGIYSYGLDIDKNKITNFPSYEESYKDNFLLLKLHGSLNWACCPSCDKNYLTWNNTYDRIPSGKCNDCNNNLEPVLIPPARDKKLPDRLRKLWDIAKEKITSADEVTIIGLSFNDYDSEASDFIFNSLKSNKRKPILCIADPRALDIGHLVNFRASTTRDHFKNIMLYREFRDYLDNKTF